MMCATLFPRVVAAGELVARRIYRIQNTYKYMIEKNYGKKVNSMYLVCLHPNNKNKSYQKIKVPDLKEEIKDLMELRLKIVSNL